MGLDMYLYKDTYVSDYKGIGVPQDEIHLTGKAAEIIKPERISYIREQVAYWRKVNCIHRWFVDNVQDGIDNCQHAYVSPEALQELLETVRTVIANPDQAMELLPPQSGFFFGATEIDEWYWRGLMETETMLTEALDVKEDEWPEYSYHSSW